MSIASVSNRWLNRIYKSIAIFLVVFAVLISALRLFLPYAHNYRQNVQDYINETANSDIIIGQLNMGWQKLGPSIIVENVGLLDTETTAVFIEKIEAKLDFWKSLREGRIITSDITLSGAKVLFEQKMLSEGANSAADNRLTDNIADIFLDRIQQFSVNNSQVIVRTQHEEKTFLINQLSWLNAGDRHRANGDVIVDGLMSNNLQVRMDVQGKTLKDINGQLYVEANQLNITPWLASVFVIEDEKTHSSINFNAWLDIARGTPTRLQVELGENAVRWEHDEGWQSLSLQSGQLFVTDKSSNENTPFSEFELFTSPLKFSANDQAWEETQLELRQSDDELFSYISHVDIKAVTKLLPLFVKEPETLQRVNTLAPKGRISNIYLSKSASGLQASAQLNNYGNDYVDGIPAIDGLNSDIYWANEQLSMVLVAQNGQLYFGEQFKRAIPYDDLTANLRFKQDKDIWQVNVSDIDLTSQELSLKGDASISAGENKAVEMTLLATLHDIDVTNAHHYYPHILMGDDLVDYLNTSLISGQISTANVLFKGPLASFPFDKHDGIFVVDAELTNSQFAFDEEWPAISDFDANLNFTNNSMVITGRNGALSGIDVTGVLAVIDDLSDKQILTVDANFVDAKPTHITHLMNNSPMADTVGESLKEIVIAKPVSGEFSLNLPLNDVDNVVAEGTVKFDKNEIALQVPRMDFTKVSGTLSYRNEVINVEKLAAKWLGLPLVIDVEGKDTAHQYETKFNIAANWLEHQWHRNMPDLLNKYGKGALKWQGELSLNMPHQGEFSYELAVKSTLEDAILALPAPYTKPFLASKSLSANVTGERDSSTIYAKVGDDLKFFGVLDHEKVSFTRAHLVLGDEQMLLPIEGFHISTQLEEADFAQWQPFILDIINSVEQASETESSATDHPLLNVPERIRGKVSNFTLFAQHLSDVSFDLTDKKQWWLLDLNAKEARSQIKFYNDWEKEGIDINADFIHLSRNLNKKKTEIPPLSDEVKRLQNEEIFRNTPPIRMRCEDCKYGKLDLGNVSFDILRNDPTRITLDNFIAKRGETSFTMDASWQHDQGISQTEIKGKLSVKDLADEVERMGSVSTVRDSGIKANYAFTWGGGPHEFALSTLNGDFGVKLDDGYLAKVPDRARAFSVLSLQSLVRKLSLDFRDIFSDGLFYSEIKGDFHFSDGVLYTQNTEMKGAAGDLALQGNTDIIKSTLDYKMSYKPNVTSSLPAIAWIATLNPVTFLAGVALEEVITSQVYYELNYEVTGTIQEPILTEVDRKTRNVRVGKGAPEIVENQPPQQLEKPSEPVKPEDKIDG